MSESLLLSLKKEISRIARKVVKSEIATLQSNSKAHRRHIAELRRKIDALQRDVTQLRRGAKTSSASRSASETDPATSIRFQARGLKTHRASLGLSAAKYASLVGVSGITIYKWESGQNRPRATQLRALAEVRQLGKRDALARLEALPK